MSSVVVISALIRLAAVAWCVKLMRELRDWRFALLATMLALMAARLVATLASALPENTGLALGELWEIPSLAVSVLGLLTAVSLGRYAREARSANRQLRQSEQRYRSLFELGPDIVVVIGLNDEGWPAELLDVNQRTLDVLGYERHEMIGHPMSEFDLHADKMRERAEAVRRDGFARFETEWAAKDGSAIPAEISVGIAALDGRLVVLGTSRSLAPEREATQNLRESEDRFRQLAENIPEAFYLYDHDSASMLYASPHYSDVVGVSPEEMLADPMAWYRNVITEDRPRLAQASNEAAAGKTFESIEFRIRLDDGTIRWLHVRSFAIPVADGRGPRSAGIVSDITDAKLAHEALLGANRDLAHAHRIAGIGSGEVDLVTGKVTLSERALAMFGLPPDTTEFAREELDLVHPDDRTLVLKSLERMAANDTKGFTSIETRMVRPDGTVWWAALTAERVDGGADTRSDNAYVRGIFQDITERKRFEELLRSLATVTALAEEHERHRLAAALHDGAVQNLGLCRVRLGQLRAEMTRYTELGEQIDAIVELVDATIRDTRSLLSEISPPVLTELGLVPAVEWLADEVEARSRIAFEVRSVDLSRTLSDDLEVLLFQTVRELVANVEKHSNATAAQIDLRMDGGLLRLSVHDNGRGLPRDLHSSGPTDDGGYGLFSIRERLRLLGGQIDIDGSKGGTTVDIELPIAGADALLAPIAVTETLNS